MEATAATAAITGGQTTLKLLNTITPVTTGFSHQKSEVLVATFRRKQGDSHRARIQQSHGMAPSIHNIFRLLLTMNTIFKFTFYVAILLFYMER
jgi:hypothetical protein